MKPAGIILLLIILVMAVAWANVFRLTFRDRRYVPKHRYTPLHRA